MVPAVSIKTYLHREASPKIRPTLFSLCFVFVFAWFVFCCPDVSAYQIPAINFSHFTWLHVSNIYLLRDWYCGHVPHSQNEHTPNITRCNSLRIFVCNSFFGAYSVFCRTHSNIQSSSALCHVLSRLIKHITKQKEPFNPASPSTLNKKPVNQCQHKLWLKRPF